MNEQHPHCLACMSRAHQRHWGDACGVCGILSPGHDDLSRLCYFGLFALQHRGQESAGIAVGANGEINIHTGMGLATEVFEDHDLDRLQGDVGLAHVRYSTMGSNVIENAQPFTAEHRSGPIAVAHNGNLVNAKSLRDELERQGTQFQATSDTEVLTQLIARSHHEQIEDAIAEAMLKTEGAYSLGIITPNKLIAVRDPHGVRPLCIGRLNGDSWVIASETCALQPIGAEYVRSKSSCLVFLNSCVIIGRPWRRLR